MLNRNAYDIVDSPSLNLPQDRCFEPAVAVASRGLDRRARHPGPAASHSGRPAKAHRPGLPQPPQLDPEKVLRAFNTWAFKREQPSDPKLLLETVARSVLQSEPVPFVMYWGKGPRCRIDAPDIACLDHLASFAQRIGAAYERGAAIKLILTDTHARLNGHLPSSIGRYFADIELGARQHGFETCWLGDLTSAAGSRAEGDPADDPFLTSDMLARLAKSAMKWYRGEGTAEDGARIYYRMNMVERRAVELAFPNAIFTTFNGSNSRWLFPNSMPIFYMYSLRRGFSVKPWFLPAEAKLCDPATCRCATPAAA
jgi:hypothetical protein